MSYSYAEKKRIRKEFGVLPHILDVPYLLSIQTESYKKFLQKDVKKENRKNVGLEFALNLSFPIKSKNGQYELHYIDYKIGEPTFDESDCQIRGATYDAPLNVKLRLVIYDKDSLPEEKKVKDVREEYVYMGDIPLMTKNGTFVINGTERVVVSQLHRSPGVFFSKDDSEEGVFSARIIPYRGSWLDFEFDSKGVIWARIDRKRKISATIVLKALDYSQEQILEQFAEVKNISLNNGDFKLNFVPSQLKGSISKFNIFDNDNNIIVKKDKKVTSKHVKQLEALNINSVTLDPDLVMSLRLAKDIICDLTGEVIAQTNDDVTVNVLEKCIENNISNIDIIDFVTTEKGRYISDTLKNDSTRSGDEARKEIYKVLRPGDPASSTSADALFNNLFFEDSRYSLSDIGRMKLNDRLNCQKVSEDVTILENSDILGVLKELTNIRDGNGEVDDIDHLGNRRVRSVGEMVENQFRVGLYRVEKTFKDSSASLVNKENLMPKDTVNSKPITSAIKEFFSSGALSQFMDQDNPLSEVTHKRRISALGPGGLSRDRAGFEVRDVHATHYSRLCPIETPEGPNIGLINSLASYSRVNNYGFLEAPYRKVINGKVTEEIEYLSATDEAKYVIAQASAKIDDNNNLAGELIQCRSGGEAIFTEASRVEYMDVSAKQMVSAAAALIPFLEHDDANRVLMGANMQRQAVPTLKSEKPMVGTGMEKIVARDSGNCIVAKNAGIIDAVDANRIVVRVDAKSSDTNNLVDIYNLVKFKRSNKSTCINQKPIVSVGDTIAKGDILADGFATDFGELSLGHNLMVAFMPWNGYNFEDSILLSEKISKDDKYTSIHIEEFTCQARDTKLGPEEITSDIPNVSESDLAKLDDSGIVHIGANVEAGDIIVAKITPKAEQQLSPEERLLKAIFNEKASNVADSSLRMPSGATGTVIDVQVFENDKGGKSLRALEIERQMISKARKDIEEEFNVIKSIVRNSVESQILNQRIAKDKQLKKGAIITKDFLEKSTLSRWLEIEFESEEVNEAIENAKNYIAETEESLKNKLELKKKSITQSTDLPNGVLKIVKVFVAVKKKIQPGDKMAGRHGNKGVVSRVLPIEDMPYMADGTPVDVCLNPLGIPSRMNIGQILEAHLGLASYGLGKKVEAQLEAQKQVFEIRQTLDEVYNAVGDKKVDFSELTDKEIMDMANNLKTGVPMATPVFDGAKESDIKSLLKLGGFSTSGQMKLFDGRTGQAFDRDVTVGYMYMLKLDHLVDNKMHARSTGSYSLVTQQPLGGKAQFGGQRFGEMEVWALQAYGAAYTLREMLTVKSDDISGRSKMYKNIVDGKLTMNVDVPESFNVLRNEVRALGIDMDFEHLPENEE